MIDTEIKRLEEMKQRNSLMQPIQNIINTNSNFDFEARFVNENDKVDEILIQRKTAFICPQNGYLKIKEIKGDITEYILTKPKTPEELKIEELERRIEEYESKLNTTNSEVIKSTTDDNEPDESTTKPNSRTASKKS